MRARFALAIALFGLVVSPLLAPQYGITFAIGVSAISAAAGIALFPEARAA